MNSIMSLLGNGPALSLAQNFLGQQVEMAKTLGPDNYMKVLSMASGHVPAVLELGREYLATERAKAEAYAHLCNTAEEVLRDGTGVVDITGDNVISISRLEAV